MIAWLHDFSESFLEEGASMGGGFLSELEENPRFLLLAALGGH